ncbi:LysR substrate-binding domain-containing protein [Antarctobacter sp.]|uniref:LysR substrate-binding domain-containing protein n=1 Tax=Antarctobacter sp. TaxID=1872577 RepID=UPI002B26F45B|nr:LysR substrate-binding domain-containing protein [Antarctobacter sp.]
MQRRFPSLNALKTFEAAARHLSFSNASEELNVTQAAVSRQIKLLEEDFGTALFHRLTRSVELTEAGQRLFPPLKDALDQIEFAAHRVWDNRGSGILTISVLPTFSVKWLMPRIVDFSEKHPDIEIHLVNSIKPVDFDREDVDLAIRVGSPTLETQSKGHVRIDLEMAKIDEQLTFLRLMPDRMVAVASPRYIAERGGVSSEQDLRSATLINMATRQHAWADFLKVIGWDVELQNEGPAYGHFFMAIQAAMEGRGIALVPDILVKDDIRSGLLVQAISTSVPSAGQYYLFGRKSGWEQKRVRIFREWLQGYLPTIDPVTSGSEFHQP